MNQVAHRHAVSRKSRCRLALDDSGFVIRLFSIIWLLCTAGVLLPTARCQAVTDEQRGTVSKLADEVSAAGQLYADGSHAQSAAKITEVQKELLVLLQVDDAALRSLLKPIHTRLVLAHGLLELEGAQLESLASWDELTAAKPMPANASTKLVSFATTVAPILLANCQGCHIGGTQASGGLRMDTFTQLLRGGDSGTVIVPSKADESLLVKKIKGEEGDRMPAGGRPALAADQITAISTWINEGATFDGPSAEMNIGTVTVQVWAAAADHSELFDRRRQRALERLTKILPNDQPATSQNDELFVLGNLPPARVDNVLKEFSAASALAKKLLKAPLDQPLLKGGLSVFVLKNRYDYSEFGRMTEQRELPKEWLGHWHADPLDVYGVVAADTSQTKPADQQAEAVALQIVAGAYLGSHSQVPAWFAEGVARNLVKTTYHRGDKRVNSWQQAYPAALSKVEDAMLLLEGRLDEETAGLVGMGLTSFLMERTNRRRFDELLDLLRAGQSFEAACSTSFASPEVMVKSWLGK